MREIEPAAAADISALIATDDPRTPALAAAIAARRCFVIRSDGRAVAHLLFGHPFFGHPFIETLYIAAPHRRQGHGRALLRFAIERHRSERLFTSTNTSNAVMRGLLLAEGFIESGVIDNLDPGDPEIVYCRLP